MARRRYSGDTAAIADQNHPTYADDWHYREVQDVSRFGDRPAPLLVGVRYFSTQVTVTLLVPPIATAIVDGGVTTQSR